MGKIKHIQYIHMPHSVLTDKNLSVNEQKVLSNIINVIGAGGVFRFHNSWIADYLQCHKNSVSRIITSLKNKNIIDVKLVRDNKGQVTERVLTLTSTGIDTYVDRVSTPALIGGIDTSVKYNTNISNTKKNTKSIIKDNTYDFDSFWNKYGKKIDRGGCLSKWKSLPQSARTLILNNLDRFIAQFEDPQYMMHPKTFLNYVKRNPEDWVDEIIEKSDSIGKVSDETWNEWMKSATGGK